MIGAIYWLFEPIHLLERDEDGNAVCSDDEDGATQAGS